MPKFPIYADYSATTPCDPAVVEAMLPFFSVHFGNAASHNHAYGWAAQEAVEIAREQVSALIGSEPGEIIFTSGATEAVNLALKGVFEAYVSKGNHIITLQTEHKAVLDTCRQLERSGAEISYLSVNDKGLPDLKEIEAAITPQTILIAVMAANNETGVLLPVEEISAIARKHDIIFFTDGTQAVGKINFDVEKLGVGLMAFSSHKLYGPKGAGALYVRRKAPRVRLIPQLTGGGQEKGRRSGTLNVPGIVGFGKACSLAKANLENESKQLTCRRDKLEKELLKFGDIHINGDTGFRLPHISNLLFRGLEGKALLMAITKNIAVSSGSACTSASPEASHVLKAMGRNDDEAYASIRFSFGRFTTDEEISFIIDHVKSIVKDLRSQEFRWQENFSGPAL